MAEIISDGTRSVTSDDTSARDYSGFRGFGYSNDKDWPERTAERIRGQAHEDTQWANELGRDIGISVERNGRSAELATEKTGAANLLATNVVSAQLNVQAEKIGASTNLAIEKTSAAGLLEATKNAAAAALAAEKCCCELKEKIGDDGQKTRDLINSVQATNLAVQLADAKTELSVVSSAAHAAEQSNLVNAIINAFSTGILPTGLKKSV